ncbi:dynein light chain 2, cytoplasmic-like protein [Ramicandelaber brevisporus]|nr:dynein light chain 2, cytoplasmic-like protein [Ramicandelaber brevisporus]
MSATTGEDLTITVKAVDMVQKMQTELLDIAQAAFQKCQLEKDIAAEIKRECDQQFGPTWHVIVGRSFGSYVTHETKHFIYFYIGNKAVMAFRSG